MGLELAERQDGGLGGLDVESHMHWSPYTAPSHTVCQLQGHPTMAGWCGLLAPTVQWLYQLFQSLPRKGSGVSQFGCISKNPPYAPVSLQTWGFI